MVKTMILKLNFIALIFLIYMSKCNSLTKTTNTTGFTTELIHRDSPQSPHYNHSLSPYQRLANAIQRSFSRVRRFKTSRPGSESPVSEVTNSGAEYLMKYAIGTPPVPSLGVADTGSDIIWTQCQPCRDCFKQNLPLFRPKNSSTYKNIPCDTNNCKSFQETSCSEKKCIYTETYGDGSSTQGDLSIDTITFASTNGRSTISAPNIIFGCGFSNSLLIPAGESGIVGLGGGPASLVRQLGPLANGKFSYCLSSDNSRPSQLSFGDSAVVLGRGVVSTPLVKKYPETFYYLTLEGISIGNQRLKFDDFSSGVKGNIVIDSGTTLTLLPFDFHAKVESAMGRLIKLRKIKDPRGELSLCFFSRDGIKNIPDVTVHFEGGDVKLRQENLFVRTSDVSLCFAAQPVDDVAVYGNVAQKNFLVGYDLHKRTVLFQAANCRKS
ncbi:hypothetical protein ABFS83_02G131000 [Erythranthe nasuta]